MLTRGVWRCNSTSASAGGVVAAPGPELSPRRLLCANTRKIFARDPPGLAIVWRVPLPTTARYRYPQSGCVAEVETFARFDSDSQRGTRFGTGHDPPKILLAATVRKRKFLERLLLFAGSAFEEDRELVSVIHVALDVFLPVLVGLSEVLQS